ncbi:MAG: HDOD domain-containing protein [Rhodocyclaceae bacterium]|nr:HDOD domain-containing protein [Rhodocyclaceae bacterium]
MSSTSPAELSHEDLQKVMATVDIPACPAVVSNAMAEAQKDEPDLRRLATLISNDPAMSAAALKLANSPLYRSGTRISGVRQAVERLGTKNVVCIVVSVALRASVTGLPAAWLEAFWKRSTQLALAAALIARRQYGISPDAAYTYTLFHDAAIPLMMKRFPNYGQVIEAAVADGRFLVDAEGEFFPCTHPIVGSLLVRNWGLPPIVGLAIRFHHEMDAYELPDKTLPGGALSFIAVTQVAEHITHELLGENDVEVGTELYQKALAHLGVGDDELDDLKAQVAEAIGADA